MSIVDTMITPVAKDYSTCSECYAELLIYPDFIHPDEITKVLGINASQLNVAGTKVTNSRGKTREIRKSGWFLTSKNEVDSKDLRDHIDWVLMHLSSAKNGLSKIQSMDGVKITLKCTWRSKYGHSGPVLWPKQMSEMAAFGLECSFDIYFDNESE